MIAEPILSSPNLIYKAHYSGDLGSAVSKAIADTVLHPENMGSMRGGGKTTANHTNQPPHTWSELEDFFKWFWPTAEHVWKQWDLNEDVQLTTENSWTNVENKKGYVLEHDHAPSHMAVSIYLQKPEHSGNIEFRNVMQPLWSGFPRKLQDKDMHDFYKEVETVSGDVVFFPGFVSHRVQPSESNELRVVMSMNINGVRYV